MITKKNSHSIILFVNLLCALKTSDFGVEAKLDKLEGKVVGGHYVPINEYAHAVFIKVVRLDGYINICGSSVVNQYLLLTAAHCLDNRSIRDKLWVYAGNENLDKVNVIRLVLKEYVHEGYSSDGVANDIALLLLQRKLPLKSNIQRTIVKQSFPSFNTQPSPSLAGWGLVNEKMGQRTIWLKAVRQTLQEPKTCFRLIGRNLPGAFCAGSLISTASRPAAGDSGSGLVTHRHQLIGILSFKSERNSALPFYTNVSYFYNWIVNKASMAHRSFCSLKYHDPNYD